MTMNIFERTRISELIGGSEVRCNVVRLTPYRLPLDSIVKVVTCTPEFRLRLSHK